MADKPLQYPDFALNDELDPITLAPNKVEPTDEFKLSGQKRRQPLPRPYLNWQFWNIGAWVRWFEEQLAGSPAATLQSAFPVGTVHLSTNSANPASYFGFGTWTAIAQGRALFGVNTGDSNFDTVRKTGGTQSHSHTTGLGGAHTHGGSTGDTVLTIAQMPAHTHESSAGVVASGSLTGVFDGNAVASGTIETGSEGGGLPHNHTIMADGSHTHSVTSTIHLNPYYCVYMWERVS